MGGQVTGHISTSSGSSVTGRLSRSQWFERLARAGYVASGLVHLLVGYLAIRVALGSNEEASQSGALAEIAAKPGGKFLLSVLCFVLFVLALWRLAEGVLGRAAHSSTESADKKDETFDRVKAIGTSFVYFSLAFTAFGFARGSGNSSGDKSTGITARLLESGGGKVLLVVAALVIIGVGIYHIHKGAKKKFVEDLKGNTSSLVRGLGMAGYIAKGVAVTVIGGLVIAAVFQADPEKASGLDAALKTLGAQPFGVFLLIAVGLGLIMYGLYSFVRARDAKM
ncbi:DUF1206 domain-containing protein [Rhodococcus coprophilus]|nr:DUF1206 domain-containing protein [Rhodococcus coprophilus]